VNRTILSLTGGLLMALGLGLSGMTHPSVVLGFLDFAGSWNPTGIFVMAAAVVTYGLAFQIRTRLSRRFRAGAIVVPARTRPDLPLVAGAALFGIGWGLVGLCPGPSIVDLGGIDGSSGARPVVVFVASMIGSMALYALVASGGLHAPWGRRRRRS
jgi:uncharacterized membrane protein YedE/YeeE